jgi:hypothetical protein
MAPVPRPLSLGKPKSQSRLREQPSVAGVAEGPDRHLLRRKAGIRSETIRIPSLFRVHELQDTVVPL